MAFLRVAIPSRAVVLGLALTVGAGRLASAASLQGSLPRDIPSVPPSVLYNAARFVSWPADVFPAKDAPLYVCVVGEDPFGAALDEFLTAKTVSDRRVVVRRNADPNSEDAGGCHVVFVAASEAARLDRLLASTGRGVLTLSTIPRFATRGGMIGLVMEDGRVRLEINTQAARDADLQVSSKLLKLARVVR